MKSTFSSLEEFAKASRVQYPILNTTNYLASHSLGAVPQASLASLQKYWQEWATLGIQAWDGPWWQSILDFNQSIEAILGAKSGTVIPMENATRGMAAIAHSIDWTGDRNEVLLTDLEFTTSYPLWKGIESLGARIKWIQSDDGITVPMSKWEEAITDRTRLVATSHVFFRSGAVQDLGTLVQWAHQKGAWVMGDGYQSVGTVPIDVQKMGVDFFVGGSHKWLCGGPGAGYLYVHPERMPDLHPQLTGWFGIRDPFQYQAATQFEPAEGVFRFLLGTVGIPALYAAREGIQGVLNFGMPQVRQYSKELTQKWVEFALSQGYSVPSPWDPEQRSGMFCLDFENSEEASRQLAARKIIVDWRPQCGIRVSPHFYNLDSDLEHFFEELSQIRAELGNAKNKT